MIKMKPAKIISIMLVFILILLLLLLYFEANNVKNGQSSLIDNLFHKKTKIYSEQDYSKIFDSVKENIDSVLLNLPDGVKFIRKRFVKIKSNTIGDYLFLINDEKTNKKFLNIIKTGLSGINYPVETDYSTRKELLYIKFDDRILFVLKLKIGYTSAVTVCIDDCGYPTKLAANFLTLDKRITFAVMPYLRASRSFRDKAAAAGFDVILHLPMEASVKANPGPDAILTNLSKKEIIERVDKALNDVGQVIGVNNHMGSKATRDRSVMRIVLNDLKNRGLFFFDSRTSSSSVAETIAKNMGVLTASRDVFLDNSRTVEYVRKQWNHLLNLAKKNGSAIAIGHCTSEPTYTVLKEELPKLKDKKIYLLKLSEIVEGVQNEEPIVLSYGNVK